MSLRFTFISLLMGLFSFGIAFASLPMEGVLKSETTAIKVAEAVLFGIYGDKIMEQRQFIAKLSGDHWVVEGTSSCSKGNSCKGGVARIEINKMDGRVRNVSHGK